MTAADLKALRKRALAAKNDPDPLRRQLHASLLVEELIRATAEVSPMRIVDETYSPKGDCP